MSKSGRLLQTSMNDFYITSSPSTSFPSLPVVSSSVGLVCFIFGAPYTPSHDDQPCNPFQTLQGMIANTSVAWICEEIAQSEIKKKRCTSQQLHPRKVTWNLKMNP